MVIDMELSRRLLGIAKMVEKKSQVGLDIGCDHGYVSIYLIKNNICKKIIASDLKKGPLEKARKNIETYGLSNKIELRQGSGFKVICENEVNFAIIGGMGGYLIRDLLLQSPNIINKLNYIIIQPMQNIEVIRDHIYDKGFEILDEKIVWDEFYYQIMKIKASNMIYSKEYREKYSYFGEKLLEGRDIFVNYAIEKKIEDINKILNSLKGQSESLLKRKMELENKLRNLEELSDSR